MANNSSIRKKKEKKNAKPTSNINKKRLARAIMLGNNLLNRKYKFYRNKILILYSIGFIKGRTKHADPSNYRPISLLSVLNRIFERNGVSWLFWRQIAFFAILSMTLGKNIPLNTH